VHIGVLLDLAHPVPDGLERTTVRHIIDQEDALRPPEVGGGDGTETFLPGRVPDLELDALSVQFEVFDLEVDAVEGRQGGREGGREGGEDECTERETKTKTRRALEAGMDRMSAEERRPSHFTLLLSL
jgi:hypothetical protein